MATNKSKNSMIVPHEWLKALEKMSREDVGELMIALLTLDSKGIPAEFESGTILDILYAQYSTYVLRNKELYEEECRRRSEAAKKREAEKAQQTTKSTTVHDKDKEKDKDRIDIKDIGQTRFAKPSLESIREYCSARGNKVDPQAFFDFYESKGWMIGKNHMKDWKAAIRTWEKPRSGTEKPKNKFNDFDQRAYTDWDAIEQAMMGG